MQSLQFLQTSKNFSQQEMPRPKSIELCHVCSSLIGFFPTQTKKRSFCLILSSSLGVLRPFARSLHFFANFYFSSNLFLLFLSLHIIRLSANAFPVTIKYCPSTFAFCARCFPKLSFSRSGGLVFGVEPQAIRTKRLWRISLVCSNLGHIFFNLSMAARLPRLFPR